MRLPPRIEQEISTAERNYEAIMRAAKMQLTSPVCYRPLRWAIEDFMKANGLVWNSMLEQEYPDDTDWDNIDGK